MRRPPPEAYGEIDVRRRRGRAKARPSTTSPELRIARRAAAAVAADDPRHEYAVTDVVVSRKGRAQRGVVYLQQRFLGLPVYDGRRSVIVDGRRLRLTGRPLAVTRLEDRIPRISADDAIRTAFAKVYREVPAELQRVAGFASAERYESFTAGPGGQASAHLAVFAEPRPRLAWVVGLAGEGHPRFEVVVDAATRRILRRRMTSQATDVEMRLAPEPAHPALLPVRAGWPGRAIWCTFNRQPVAFPDPVGDVIAGAGQEQWHALNAYCIANRVLDVLARYLTVGVRFHFELFDELIADPALAAYADADRVVLRGVPGGFARYAAIDPTIVAHEVGHVVLNTVVGGSAYATPFETGGASRAVSEGLADYLGLTIWNAAGRDLRPAEPASGLFGPWLLGGQRRDYATYDAGVPVPIPHPGSVYEAGRALCGTLLLARRSIADALGGEAAADDVVWYALFQGILALPHQGNFPWFCCVRKALTEAPGLPGPAAARIEGAFARMGLPPACQHIREGS